MMLDHFISVCRGYLTGLPDVNLETLEDLRKYCLINNIYSKFGSFEAGCYNSSVLRIYGFFNGENLTNLAVYHEDIIINHLINPLEFDSRRLKAADRQGTRPDIRHESSKFCDRISKRQVHWLISRAADKLK